MLQFKQKINYIMLHITNLMKTAQLNFKKTTINIIEVKKTEPFKPGFLLYFQLPGEWRVIRHLKGLSGLDAVHYNITQLGQGPLGLQFTAHRSDQDKYK